MDLSAGPLEVSETTALTVEDGSQVAAARRHAAEVTRALGFDETASGRVALAVTEAATNLLKHAGRGEILLGASQSGGHLFVEVLALDRGPGMGNVDECFEDGYSTAGSAGTGLGALRRLASTIDVYSRPGGTALLIRIGAATDRPGTVPRRMVGGLSVARGGEDQCGDAWDHELRAGVLTVLVTDGLGHGTGAAEAARECVRTFRRHGGKAPMQRVEMLHQALRGTRGAALAVAEVDLGRRVVRFAGLGNITASLHGDGPVRHLVSHHGIAGHNARRIEEYIYPWPARGVLIMHSDGLTTLRDVGSYPGLMERDPGTIAGVLYRDLSRRRDDASVVVARESAP